ncbi:MAG: rhodanese-like domain-containing protein [Saprospiraceae bacterium]
MKFLKTIITLVSFILLVATGMSCKKSVEASKAETETQTENSSEPQAKALEPSEFGDEMKKNGAIIVDLRFPQEFEQGHIDGAINVNFFDPKFQENILKLDKTKKYFLYSKAEPQTKRAGIYMRQNGFTDVNYVKGGYEAWKESGKK